MLPRSPVPRRSVACVIARQEAQRQRPAHPRPPVRQGDLAVEATCVPAGELKLEGVEVSAWQAIELPRLWDDSDREPDPHPHVHLVAMFERVRAALHGWMEAMDHLR
jgi:hypothetical protein